LNDLLTIFLNNLLPIFLIAGAGYLLSRFLKVNPRPYSQIAFNLFTPFLIFNLLTQNNLGGLDILRPMLFALVLTLLAGAITWIIGKLFKIESRTVTAMLLTTMFMNSGNYGLPVVLFAFGQASLSSASLFFVTSSILIYTLGVVIASKGSAGILKALTNLARIPAIYAIILALLFKYTGWIIPLPLERTAQLLGDAAIPSLIVLLGMQLHTNSGQIKALPMGIASIVRLVICPILAFLLIPLFGITGVARQGIILESAMPAAVMSTLIATEFDIEPSFVTAVVFLTTLLSPLTLTVLLSYLGA
jgi:predicted permease